MKNTGIFWAVLLCACALTMFYTLPAQAADATPPPQQAPSGQSGQGGSCYYTDQDDYICNKPGTPGEPTPPDNPAPATKPPPGKPPQSGKSNRPEYESMEECSEESMGTVEEEFRRFMIAREGYEHVVYKDSEGHPTVGIGHKVLPEDNLKLGDRISDERIEELYLKDSTWAIAAAREDSAEADGDDCFTLALASVNYQMGPAWNKPSNKHCFCQTWEIVKQGRYLEAADRIEKSKWMKQTPTRAKDFQKALRDLDARKKKAAAGGASSGTETGVGGGW